MLPAVGRLLTVEEALELIPVSRAKLEHDRAAGRITFYRIGKRSYFRPADLEVYVLSHRRGPAQASAE